MSAQEQMPFEERLLANDSATWELVARVAMQELSEGPNGDVLPRILELMGDWNDRLQTVLLRFLKRCRTENGFSPPATMEELISHLRRELHVTVHEDRRKCAFSRRVHLPIDLRDYLERDWQFPEWAVIAQAFHGPNLPLEHHDALAGALTALQQRLTPTELSILEGRRTGKTNVQLAAELHCSPNHVQNTWNFICEIARGMLGPH